MNKLVLQAAAAACALLPGAAMAASASFTVSATVQPAVSVSCSQDLRFGTVSVEPNNSQATILVDSTSGATATSTSFDVYPAESDSGPASCTVTNTVGLDTTAQLSATSTSETGATLSNVKLVNGDNTLSAALTLSKASGISNETVYVGGTLTIPANYVDWGDYTETVTLTVTFTD